MSFRTSLAAQLVALSALYSFSFLPLASFAAGADPTLEPIASDEPVPPASFPPIPDRLNLSNAIATAPGAASTSSNSGSAVRPSYHQGYGHVPAGAYLQRQAAPGQPAAGTESYNVNTSSQNSAPRLPELPTPVTVSQSTTQDLSLPDDEFSDYHQKKRHNNIAGNMLRGYMFGAAGMATGLGLGSLRY